MKTYTYPHTDIAVSRIVYGTWHLGVHWDRRELSSEIMEHGVKLIEAAVEAGITLIDLADIYTRGKSDLIVAEAFKRNPGMRESLTLQSKAGIILPEENSPGRYDFSYDNLVSSVEGSLQRLGTDRLEVLLLHRPDALVEPEEVARAFDHLQSSGKVLHFGVSNHTPMQMELLKRYIDQPIVANQIEINLLHNELIRDGIIANTQGVNYTAARGTLDYCRLNDIMVQAWSPVAGGRLFNPKDDAPDNEKAVAAEIVKLAEKYETNVSAIAIAWLLRHPAGIMPILGTMKPHRLAESVEADNIELTHEEWYRLFEAANGAGVP
ncbi:MAG: aldo/keto reductase [Chloroflexota bacterium]